MLHISARSSFAAKTDRDYPTHDTTLEENRRIDATFPREHLPGGCPSDADLASPFGPSFLPVFPKVEGCGGGR